MKMFVSDVPLDFDTSDESFDSLPNFPTAYATAKRSLAYRTNWRAKKEMMTLAPAVTTTQPLECT